MNPLNFHNFFVLAELYNYQNKVLVMLDRNPVACISDNIIRTADNEHHEVDPLLHHILCNPSNATLAAHTNITCNKCNWKEKQSLPETLLRYIKALPDSFLTRMDTDYITIMMKHKPNPIEYKYFMEISKNFVPPDMFQWLTECFELMQEMSFSDLYSLYYMDKKGDRDDLLRSLLMLNSLGFITCLYNDDTLSLMGNDNRWIQLRNKLFLAIYIAAQLNKHNHVINIKCDNCSYTLNLLEPIDENLKNISISELFFSVLSGSNYTGETFFVNTAETANFNAIRLNLFEHIKRLPAELYEENFSNDASEYLLLLRDNDYAKHLTNYIKAGMDMTDLSVLSLLKSSKVSVSEITNILPYPTEEINKSIFSLLVLGLITVEMAITSDYDRALVAEEIFDFRSMDMDKPTEE